jgi:hypothetical protein
MEKSAREFGGGWHHLEDIFAKGVVDISCYDGISGF